MPNKSFEDDNFTLTLKNECFIDIQIKDFKELEKEDIVKIQDWVSKNSTKKVLCNLVEFGNGSGASRGAREYAASKGGNTLTVGTAIIVRNLAQQLIMNYYIKYNNPIYPTQVFYKREKALEWIDNEIADSIMMNE
jgi:hypothetical protein